ncbi:MAG: putative bifunctional diguanylate cyclase/phosphodiesterase [Candidatus Dormibacteria bacterium]
MQALRVLMLEDRPADAELVIHELRRGGYDAHVTRVEDEAAFQEAIGAEPWDLVLADFNLPGYDAVSALREMNRRGIDVPFIIVSGGIGEDVAVSAVREGAADYLLKDRLGRLGSAVEHAIEQKGMRSDRARVAKELHESQERFRRVFEEGAVGMAIVGPDSRFLEVNDALCEMLGYARPGLGRLSIRDVSHPEDYEATADLSRRMFAGELSSYRAEKRYLKRTGEVVWVQLSVSLVRGDGDAPLYSIGVLQDVTERKVAEQEMRFLALHDTLTGLPNRTLFTDRLQQAILSAGRDGSSFGLLIMDLDRFKEVNDSLGHQSGDLLLQQMAARLTTALRQTDTVARLGGDEFGVLPFGVQDVQGSVLAAQKIIGARDLPFTLGQANVEVRWSIGIAQYPEHGRDADSLMRHADAAMYVAKRTRSGYAVYAPEHDEHSAGRLALVGELRQAIRSRQLVLYYQPKVDFRSGHTTGVEALVRWQHPTRGLMMPDQFIPLAEQTDLMAMLAKYVMTEAMEQTQRWHQSGLPLGVAVNLSAANLHDASLPEQAAELLQAVGLPPSVLTVEITESAIMIAQADRTVRQLRDMGIGISIDDFGTGYSSLSYLKTLPVSEIKIDKSFVKDMAVDSDDAAIVQPTIDLGHNLRIKVVAEGVEDESTWKMLSLLGCDYAQGWYMSRAVPADELETWLRSSPWGMEAKITA